VRERHFIVHARHCFIVASMRKNGKLLLIVAVMAKCKTGFRFFFLSHPYSHYGSS